MRQKILDMVLQRGMLLDPLAANHILSQKDPCEYASRVLGAIKEIPLVLTLESLTEYENVGDTNCTVGKEEICTGETAAVATPTSDIDSNLTNDSTAQSRKGNPQISYTTTTPVPAAVTITVCAPNTVQKASPEILTTPMDISTVNLTTQQQCSCTSAIKSRKPVAAEHDFNIKVIRDISGNSTTNGTVKGFAEYFRDRFEVLSGMLKNKRELSGAVDLRTAKRSSGQVKAIGMVTESRTTKNGNKMLMLEDHRDTLRVIITKDNRHFSETTLLDEVIGIVGVAGKGEMVLAESILRPEIPGMRVPNKAKVDLCAAFISDIHAGSKTFLPESWERFTRWLKTAEDGAEKIKYLVVSGDIVDGVGVFPNQEAELRIQDIHEQYSEFAHLASDVPEHIKMIILPGNHDAVRPGEPQPTFPLDIRKNLSGLNAEFLGNPSTFSLEGVNVLAYHGRSFDDFISHFPGMSYSSPLPVMKEMLKRRHIAPMYGEKTPIAPESKDYLLIDQVPDIFVTGHVHSVGTEVYRGVILINSSTWQAQTAYQVMHNFNPVPAKVPIVNLMTGEWEVRNFL